MCRTNATDIVIKHLDITVTSETGTDTSQSGTWGFNMNVEPGEQATFYGILANTTQPTVVNVVTHRESFATYGHVNRRMDGATTQITNVLSGIAVAKP